MARVCYSILQFPARAPTITAILNLRVAMTTWRRRGNDSLARCAICYLIRWANARSACNMGMGWGVAGRLCEPRLTYGY
jgi:hypothetical protein